MRMCPRPEEYLLNEWILFLELQKRSPLSQDLEGDFFFFLEKRNETGLSLEDKSLIPGIENQGWTLASVWQFNFYKAVVRETILPKMSWPTLRNTKSHTHPRLWLFLPLPSRCNHSSYSKYRAFLSVSSSPISTHPPSCPCPMAAHLLFTLGLTVDLLSHPQSVRRPLKAVS